MHHTLSSWNGNDTNTVFTAQGRRGKYIITFVKFTASMSQVWCLDRPDGNARSCTDHSSLDNAVRHAELADSGPLTY